MLKSIVILSAIFSTGCNSMLVNRLAGLNDEALKTAEFVTCEGGSVGAVRRHYGEKDRAKLWRDLCNSTDEFTPVK